MNKLQLKELILEVMHDEQSKTPYTAWKEKHDASNNTNSFKSFLYQAYDNANAKESSRLEKAFPDLFITKII